MKIVDITTYHLRWDVPEKDVISSSQKAFKTREVAVVKVITDAGTIGIGESLGNPEIVIPVIQKVLKPLIIGKNALNITSLWDLMLKGNWFRAQTGVMVEAISAVDIALWDIKGKALSTPIYNLLGGAQREQIPVYATGLYLNSPEKLKNEALGYVQKGFKAMKLKIGYPEGIKKDIEQITLIRDTIGDDIKLMLDANCKYDLKTAMKLLKELSAVDIAWVEEPLRSFGPHHDIHGYCRLNEHSVIPIAWGEGEYLLLGFKNYLVNRCIDIIQPDVCRCGGITEAFRVAQTALTFGVKYAPHFWTSGIGLAATLHLAAAAGENFYICEYDQSPNEFRETLTDICFTLENGGLPVPDGPGLGIALNEDVLEKYSVL